MILEDGLLLLLCCLSFTVCHDQKNYTVYTPDCSDGRGLVPNPYNCSQFYQCSATGSRVFLRNCPDGLVFNDKLDICDFPRNVIGRCAKSGVKGARLVRLVGDIEDFAGFVASAVRCPNGSFPIDCFCSSPGPGCSGAVVSDRDCAILNSALGEKPRAVALCLYDDLSLYTTVANEDLATIPGVTCPSGYELIRCLHLRRWENREHTFVEMDHVSNSCRSQRHCLPRQGCKLQAICRKRFP